MPGEGSYSGYVEKLSEEDFCGFRALAGDVDLSADGSGHFYALQAVIFCFGREICVDVLDSGERVDFLNGVGVDFKIEVAVGGDGVVGCLLAVVPVVENQGVVAGVCVEGEHFVGLAVDFALVDYNLAGPCAVEFAVAIGVEAERAQPVLSIT